METQKAEASSEHHLRITELTWKYIHYCSYQTLRELLLIELWKKHALKGLVQSASLF